MTREKYGGADVVLRMEADSRRRIGKQMQNEMMKTQQAMGEDDVVEDEHIPSINPKSASMRIDIPVHQRLYDHAVQLQIEKKKLQVCNMNMCHHVYRLNTGVISRRWKNPYI